MALARAFRIPLALLTLFAARPAQVTCQENAQNWPQFRGPSARGISEGFKTPTEWNVETGKNVAWETAIPGLAHSSPIVWGERIFVTTTVRSAGEAELSSLYGSPGYGAGDSVMDEGEQTFHLYCLDKNSGEILWQRTATKSTPKTKRHPKGTHANPTPTCNATRVIASFGSEGLYCFDHDGELIWERDLGLLNVGAPGFPDKNGYQWGYASSPILYDDLVLVQCDHEGESYLAAFDLNDGNDVWRTPRQENSTWSTPTVHETAANGRLQVILNGYKHIGGYDLETGEEIWKVVGGGDVPVPTPVVAHGLIFLTSAHGRARPIRAISVEASGEIGSDPREEDYLEWMLPRRGIYMQTPMVYGDLLYCCSDGGILSCYEAKTGVRVYRQRLGSGITGFSASAVAAGGQLYFSGESGEVYVVRAGREFEILAVNDMGETCMATPAISEGSLFFRTRHKLIAIK